MNTWACDDCRRRPELHAARGRCGGSFGPGLRAQRGPAGPYVEGADICSAARGSFRRDRFTSCPVAQEQQSWVREVLELFRRSCRGERLTNIVQAPTAMLWEAMDVLAAELDIIHELRHEIRRAQKAGGRR